MHTEVKFTGLAQSLRVDPAVCIENPDRSLRVGPCSGSTLWISGHRCGFGAGAGSGPGSEGDFGASGKSCGAPSSAFGRTEARGERQVASGKRQVARGPARTGAAASSCCRSPRQPPHRTPPVRGPCCRYAAPFSWTHRRPSASSGRFCRLNQADGSTRQGLRRSIWSTWNACEGAATHCDRLSLDAG